MVTTRVFTNTSKNKVVVASAGLEFAPKQTLSITSEFHLPINHPDIVEVTGNEE